MPDHTRSHVTVRSHRQHIEQIAVAEQRRVHVDTFDTAECRAAFEGVTIASRPES